jgi:hypothetical protein
MLNSTKDSSFLLVVQICDKNGIKEILFGGAFIASNKRASGIAPI